MVDLLRLILPSFHIVFLLNELSFSWNRHVVLIESAEKNEFFFTVSKSIWDDYQC